MIFSQIWSGILIKYPIEDHGEYYIDDVLDFGYESEAMIIEPEEYIRFPLPKGIDHQKSILIKQIISL